MASHAANRADAHAHEYRIVSNTGRVLARANNAQSAVELWVELTGYIGEPIEIEEASEA